MNITLVNLMGPDVGSSVYVYVKSKELRDDFSALTISIVTSILSLENR